MKKELEVTFPNVNHHKLIKKIKEIGAICYQKKTLMRRVVFMNPSDPEYSFFRVRDEGNKITCTYKNISKENQNILSVSEVETEIKDFDSMKQILLLAGLPIKAYQETYRETWTIGEEVHFMLDEWPGLKPFIEIEGKSEEIVKKYTKELGFNYDDGIFGTIDKLYLLELGIPRSVINTTPEITFKNPPKKYDS